MANARLCANCPKEATHLVLAWTASRTVKGYRAVHCGLCAGSAMRSFDGAIFVTARDLRDIHPWELSDPTRDEWLEKVADEFRPLFEEEGSPLPEKIRFSCGWPSARGRGEKNRVIGECHSAEASSDGTVEIFVSPVVGDGVTAAAVLVHELVHAAGCSGHGKGFRKLAVAMGLEGKMTATVASTELVELLEGIIQEKVGPYPHAELRVNDGGSDAPKKQGTRMIKVLCPSEECGYTVRTTQKWIDIGLPTCPCGEDMVTEEKGDGDDE